MTSFQVLKADNTSNGVPNNIFKFEVEILILEKESRSLLSLSLDYVACSRSHKIPNHFGIEANDNVYKA